MSTKEDTGRTYELSPYHRVDDRPRVPLHATWMDPREDDAVFDFRKQWGVLYKHRYVIGIAFLAVVSVVALNVFTAGRLYTAMATIQIERSAPNVAPVSGIEYIERFKDDFLLTQYRVVRSRSIAARVIRKLSLADDPRFSSYGGPGVVLEVLNHVVRFVAQLFAPSAEQSAGKMPAPPQSQQELGIPDWLIDQYLGMLTVVPIPATRLAAIGFTTPNRSLSAEMANEHVAAYRDFIIDQRVTVSATAKEILEEEVAKSKVRLVAAEAALNRFRKDRDVVGIDGEVTDVVSVQLVDLNTRLAEARARRIAIESQHRLIKERKYEWVPAVANDDSYRNLNLQLGHVRSEIAELQQKFKPAYPKLREVLAKERELKSQIDTHVRRIVGTIESSYLEAKQHEAMLEERFREAQERVLAQKDISADYQALKREVTTAHEIYGSLLQRQKNIDVAEEIKVTNVWTVDSAVSPTTASHPEVLKSLLYAAAGGMVLAIALAFFLEHLDNTVKNPEDVRRHFDLPTLGVVPTFQLEFAGYGALGRLRGRYGPSGRRGFLLRRDADSNGSKELILQSKPRSLAAEAYRTIRTAILLSDADAQPKVIVVTSSSPLEGKTVTAINEALALAETGGKVLLIDGDIRKPRLRALFDLPGDAGLSSYLTGQASLESVLFEISRKQSQNGDAHGDTWGLLRVIPAGPQTPNPAELVGSLKMRALIDRLRVEYDFVVIDTPPSLPVTDAVLLSALADKVLLVVRANETPVEVVERCIERLLRARSRLLGVVLNDVDTSREPGYGSYYSYYGDPELIPAQEA